MYQTMESTHIAILGGGNLGKSIALGLASTHRYAPETIIVTKRRLQGLEELTQVGIQLSSDSSWAVQQAHLVLLCVQPKQLNALLTTIRPQLDPGRHVLVSTITGLSISEIEQQVGEGFAVVRAMPNTAIAIRESMTTLATKNASSEALNQVKELFDVMGRTLIIEEELMAAATVLGASGIAFCLRYIRAAAQGGIQMGFHAEEAQAIAVQTCRGAASLILEAGKHPEREIDKVTTPQGCTIAGLNEMEHNGMSSAIIRGLMASFEKIASIQEQVKK